MTYYAITSIVDGRSLFDGHYPSFRQCVEDAVATGTSLAHADMRRANLLNAMLDGADLRGADFTGANLCGGNMSESCLDNALFHGTCLINAVLCESSLCRVRFIDCSFGATLVDAAHFNGACFSGLSTFTLAFATAQDMHDCRFINPCGTVCPMARPPLVVSGLSQTFVVLDRHIKVGHSIHSLDAALPGGDGPVRLSQMRLRLEQVIAGTRAKAA